jgi:hypothetical protein
MIMASRRCLIAGGAAFLGLPLTSCASSLTVPGENASTIQGARDLYVFGLPVLEMARSRDRTIGEASNVFRHARRLSDASTRRVTTPNNDTLYSAAWIDMRKGPVEIAVPATGVRYFSLALMDMYSNNFHIAGTRSTEGKAHKIRLVPPDSDPEADEVRAPTWWVFALGRTLVLDADDLPSAQAVQAQLSVLGAPGPAPLAVNTGNGSAQELLGAMRSLLGTEAPPNARDAAILDSIARGGLQEATFSGVDPDDLERGIKQARSEIDSQPALTRAIKGWNYPDPSLGDFGTNYLYRASIAIWGLAALPPVEAMYMRAINADGQRVFDGQKPHALRFPAGAQPPVSAFWSLSMYEALPDGQLFFTANSLNRFAIGDRTEGLTYNSDGSLEIWIGHADPGPERRANWLPAPSGAFALILRTYLPQAPLLTGAYRLPPVEAL